MIIPLIKQLQFFYIFHLKNCILNFSINNLTKIITHNFIAQKIIQINKQLHRTKKYCLTKPTHLIINKPRNHKKNINKP